MKITLCGSTRFIEQFHNWNLWLTLQGHTVYSVAISVKGNFSPTEDQKQVLDLIHLSKIEESDAILVIVDARDPNQTSVAEPYIGFSTKREIQWAEIRNKEVFFTNEPNVESELHIASFIGD